LSSQDTPKKNRNENYPTLWTNLPVIPRERNQPAGGLGGLVVDSGGARVATIIPMMIAPSGKSRKEIQKKASLLRPFRSAALPMSKLITIAAARKTIRRNKGAAVNARELSNIESTFACGTSVGQVIRQFPQREAQGERPACWVDTIPSFVSV